MWISSKAQYDATHPSTCNDRIPLVDSQGSSSSGYDDSSPKVSPSPSTTTFSRLTGVVIIIDTFEHPPQTVDRTVIRSSPSHSLFTLPFKRSPSSPGPMSHFWTPESKAFPDPRPIFEEELEASLRRWEDERKGHKATEIYVVVDRETAHESWRSLSRRLTATIVHQARTSPVNVVDEKARMLKVLRCQTGILDLEPS